jgi:pheromone shutdown protein TraB
MLASTSPDENPNKTNHYCKQQYLPMQRFYPVQLIWFATLVLLIIAKDVRVSARPWAFWPKQRSSGLMPRRMGRPGTPSTSRRSRNTDPYQQKRGGDSSVVTEEAARLESAGNETVGRSEDMLAPNGGLLGAPQQVSPSPKQAAGTTSVDGDAAPLPQAEKWRALLPDELRAKRSNKSIQKLRLGQTDIYLIGTAHVSNDSATDTRVLMDHVQPDCVFVELCDMRIGLLQGSGEEEDESEVLAQKNMTFFQKVREARAAEGTSLLFALSSVLLSSWQDDFAGELGVELGGEFKQAHKYWLKQPDTHLILGDRPLTLTLYRAWESLAWWPKLKVVLGLLWSSFKKPNKEEVKQWLDSIMKEESDVLTKSMAELRQSFPTLYSTIIEERDAWLAAKLVQTCRALQQGRPNTMVAIIGAGHMPGVCRWLTTPPSNTTPEQVLSGLVATKRWANDEIVQKEAIPAWIHHVSELHRGQ